MHTDSSVSPHHQPHDISPGNILKACLKKRDQTAFHIFKIELRRGAEGQMAVYYSAHPPPLYRVTRPEKVSNTHQKLFTSVASEQ